MYYHSRKTHKKYRAYPKPESCHFCDPSEFTPRLVAEREHAYVIPNRTFYDQWELRRVVDHLLLVPKEHVLQLADLSEAARQDVIDLMAEYEAAGYEIYARSPKSVSRSVAHQHTHLIKTDDKSRRGLFFWEKPYILLRFK